MRVLVCGGRWFGVVAICAPEDKAAAARKALKEWQLLRTTLEDLHWDKPISAIIHGAARGADQRAALWASQNEIREESYPADWKAHGRAAGPIRNSNMIAEGKPDLVVAFPGGRGTADCVRQARAAGIEVIEVPRRPTGDET